MSGAKKTGSMSDSQVNAKIQRKFDLVFPENNTDATKVANANEESEKAMESKKNAAPQIDLDFSLDEETSVTGKSDISLKFGEKTASENRDLDFSLAFSLEGDEATKVLSSGQSAQTVAEDDGLDLDTIDLGNAAENVQDSTKKTVVINLADLAKSVAGEDKDEFEIDTSESSIDMMSNEESKANIESTIKDILRPNFEETVIAEDSFKAENTNSNEYDLNKVEDTLFDIGGNTPAQGFALNESSFLVDTSESENDTEIKDKKDSSNDDLTSEFSLTSNVDEDDLPTRVNFQMPEMFAATSTPASPPVTARMTEAPTASLGSEDSLRFQATIRALREEREGVLLQVKNLKLENKELEQDNLTLKANLDEAKIEITILRKRHMVELEDLKYRLGMSEEKKALADEKARQADIRREKLEQKVRIDFNQVKQREKELENKLEMLSMDVDSQVQSREHKILELRRKIDALEFNMENASIKEQKSLEDKRKLEDRLSKIMKTLRHSIKNLEDDIDHVDEDSDHQKEKS